MYKTKNGLTPNYISDLFNDFTSIHSVNTRGASNGDFMLPKVNVECFKNSLSFNGPYVWNNLPNEVRNANSVMNFKQMYKRILCPNF